MLVDQYDRMRETAMAPELDRLWRDLGIQDGATGVSFDDDAPLICLALTRAA